MTTATTVTNFKENYKYYSAKALEGDVLIITRPKCKNVVLISEDAYNDLKEASNNNEQVT